MYNMDSYPVEALAIARSRGWSREQHEADLATEDEDAFGTSHPINWLNEREGEEYFG